MNKPTAIEDIYPLSPLQSGLLFHTLLEPNSGLLRTTDLRIAWHAGRRSIRAHLAAIGGETP